MSSFTSPLILEYLDGGSWLLNQEFTYRIGDESSELGVRVPAGFVTDFASIPQFFWRILPPCGIYGKAAVLHDFLYATQTGTREWCDSIFLEAMEVLNVPFWKRRTMYKAVRLFGWLAWEQHAKNKANQSTGDSKKVEKMDGSGLQPCGDGLSTGSSSGS